MIQEIDSRLNIPDINLYNYLQVSSFVRALHKQNMLLLRKYNIKNLANIKMIIGRHITKNFTTKKIDQLVFTKDLVIDYNFANYNAHIAPINTKSNIEITEANNKEKNPHTY